MLIAGFGTGLLVAALRGPKRLFKQVRGLADGFFVPLFFVVVGARLDFGALFHHPSILRLTAALLVLTVAIQSWSPRESAAAPPALIATAQLGVPAAVVALGLQQEVLTPAQGAAIITAALGSLGIATLGTTLLAREARKAAGEKRPPEPSLPRRRRTADRPAE